MLLPSSTWQSCRASTKAGGSKRLVKESVEDPDTGNRGETQEQVASLLTRGIIAAWLETLWRTDRRGAADNISLRRAVLTFLFLPIWMPGEQFDMNV